MSDESVEPQSLSGTPGQSSKPGLSTAEVTTPTAEASVAVQPAAAHVASKTGHADAPTPQGSPPVMAPSAPAVDPKPPSVADATRFAHVSPSACSSEAGGGVGPTQAPQLVLAIGQLGFDFGTEARRDSIMQHMKQPANPHDPAQLLEHLKENPWDAASVIWTLNQEATPIYAVQAHGSFATEAYDILLRFLREQLHDGVERVSIPGIIIGRARLFTGQIVPIIIPEPHGMYSWTTAALVEAVCGKGSEKGGPNAGQDAYAKKAQALREFLDRVYHELRNLGVTPQERAINYSATNAFQVGTIFEDAAKQELALDRIEVERSPICRPYSDCWDVKLIFFNPKRRLDEARRVHRFAVDVSDLVPVLVGEVRSWPIY